MLVLARQEDQIILIGNDIEVTVVDIRGDKVRLGITAPKDLGIHRKEVYDAIKREGRDPAKAGGSREAIATRPKNGTVAVEQAAPPAATDQANQRQTPVGFSGPQVVHRQGPGARRKPLRGPGGGCVQRPA